MTSLILLSEWQKSQIEFWKPVEGFPGYEVSSVGQVRSFRVQVGVPGKQRGHMYVIGRTPRPLKLVPHRQGYLQAYLYGPQGRKIIMAHRLVAKAFVPNPCGLREVNHRSAVKCDNRADNLEWVTRTANQRHAIKHGLVHPFGKAVSQRRLKENYSA